MDIKSELADDREGDDGDCENSDSTLPFFIVKLLKMLGSTDKSQWIHWGKNGTTVVMPDITAFAEVGIVTKMDTLLMDMKFEMQCIRAVAKMGLRLIVPFVQAHCDRILRKLPHMSQKSPSPIPYCIVLSGRAFDLWIFLTFPPPTVP